MSSSDAEESLSHAKGDSTENSFSVQLETCVIPKLPFAVNNLKLHSTQTSLTGNLISVVIGRLRIPRRVLGKNGSLLATEGLGLISGVSVLRHKLRRYSRRLCVLSASLVRTAFVSRRKRSFKRQSQCTI